MKQVVWWLGWIAVSILSFFASCWFWTRIIAERVGPMSAPGAALWWVIAVFGTWMVCLVPLIVVMYAKVDKAYEDARLSREKREAERRERYGPRVVGVDAEGLNLGPRLVLKLSKLPRALKRGHLVTAVLKDGRRIENVFVIDGRTLAGVYGWDEAPFRASDIEDLEPADLDRLSAFTAEGWTRLEGAGGKHA